MTEAKIKLQKVAVRDTLHLFGGLRAGTHQDEFLVIYPTRTAGELEIRDITDTRDYRSAIRRVGLDLIGHDSISNQGRFHLADWHLFEPEAPGLASPLVKWPQIAFSAHKLGDAEATEMARDVAFALRTSSLRLRDICHAYARQNDYAVLKKIAPGTKFSNVESFDLYMALHAFLTEASSARDYLARYVAKRVLNILDIETMAGLYRHVRSCQPSHGLAEEILKVCDQNRPEGWMARLTRFRNLVIHKSPITKWSEQKYLTSNELLVGESQLLTIYLGIPRDPINAPNDNYVDALVHFRSLLLQLLRFASLVVEASSIKPEMPNITERDLR